VLLFTILKVALVISSLYGKHIPRQEIGAQGTA